MDDTTAAKPAPSTSAAPANTVYFNGACPVCRAGIDAQKGIMGTVGQCELMWVDINEEPAAVEALGLTLDSVREKLVVTDAFGRAHQGAGAFALMFEHTWSQRWAARLLRWAPAQKLAEKLYARLARRLYAWNIRKKHWTPTHLVAPAPFSNPPSAPPLATAKPAPNVLKTSAAAVASPAPAAIGRPTGLWTLPELLTLAETPAFHALVLKDYVDGGYSLGVGAHPEQPQVPILHLQLVGMRTPELRFFEHEGRPVPVLMRGGFRTPDAYSW